jgi:hypothetical protein
MTPKELRGVLDRLERDGHTVSKIENPLPGDRTKSYYVTSSGLKIYGMEPFAQTANGISERANPFAQKANVNVTKGQILIKEDYKVNSSFVCEGAHAKNENSANLKAEPKKTPIPNSAGPLPAAPPPPGWQPVNPEEEVQVMIADDLCREHFFRQTRLPLERFDTLLADFLLKVRSESHQHNNRKDFRSHFFNWARTRHGGGNETARPGMNGAPAAGPSYANLKTYGA